MFKRFDLVVIADQTELGSGIIADIVGSLAWVRINKVDYTVSVENLITVLPVNRVPWEPSDMQMNRLVMLTGKPSNDA